MLAEVGKPTATSEPLVNRGLHEARTPSDGGATFQNEQRKLTQEIIRAYDSVSIPGYTRREVDENTRRG